jgi:hypothetical protein
MRWHEIFNEDISIVAQATGAVMDIITSLKSQGLEKVTVDQVLGLLKHRPEFDGSDIEADLVGQALKNVKGIKIEPDIEAHGQMTIFWNSPTPGRQVDDKQAEKDAKNIRSAAMRSIAKDDK